MVALIGLRHTGKSHIAFKLLNRNFKSGFIKKTEGLCLTYEN